MRCVLAGLAVCAAVAAAPPVAFGQQQNIPAAGKPPEPVAAIQTRRPAGAPSVAPAADVSELRKRRGAELGKVNAEDVAATEGNSGESAEAPGQTTAIAGAGAGTKEGPPGVRWLGPADVPSAVEARDPATVNAYLESKRNYYRFLNEGYAYTMRVYGWQERSSKLIFAVVVLLVLAGLFFSWLQFRDDMRHRAHLHRVRTKAAAAARTAAAVEGAPAGGAKGDEGAPEEPARSHLKISREGVEVSSTVLGIVILVISLAFFYLYLVHVYPISEVR